MKESVVMIDKTNVDFIDDEDYTSCPKTQI